MVVEGVFDGTAVRPLETCHILPNQKVFISIPEYNMQNNDKKTLKNQIDAINAVCGILTKEEADAVDQSIADGIKQEGFLICNVRYGNYKKHEILCRKQMVFVILLFLTLLFSCRIEPDGSDKQIIEYNPQKAGAEIVNRIDAPNGLYVSYTNHHLYLISIDKIIIFNLSGDNIQIENEYSFRIDDFYPDITDDGCREHLTCKGIINQNSKLTFILQTEQWSIARHDYTFPVWLSEEYNYFNGILVYDINNSQLNYSDLSVDIDYNNKTDCIFYNISNQMLYVAEKVSGTEEKIYRYSYSDYIGSLYDKSSCSLREYSTLSHFFITDDYMIDGYYHIRSNGEWISSYLYIRKILQSELIREITLTYLNLRCPPLSAFSDDKGNIWLYVKEYDSEAEQDKYEMLKLKLL